MKKVVTTKYGTQRKQLKNMEMSVRLGLIFKIKDPTQFQLEPTHKIH